MTASLGGPDASPGVGGEVISMWPQADLAGCTAPRFGEVNFVVPYR
jgi:hypothetical protein